MGLMEVFWKRALDKDEKEEKEREKLERKVSKTTEEVVTAIGEQRIENRRLAELDKNEDKTGMISWVASFTKSTRGTYDVLTPEAQAHLGWLIRRGWEAHKVGNKRLYDYVSATLVEVYGIVVPMLAPKPQPDVYTYPVLQKPGQNMPPQSSGV